MNRKFIAAAGLLVGGIAIIAAAAMADPGYGRRGDGDCGRGHGPCRSFDEAKREQITGTVIAVEQVHSRRGNGQGMELKVDTTGGQVLVHIGPQWYLEKQAVKIAAGDAVEITGSMAHRRGDDIFIASEVRKGNEVLKLRDENGAPAWRGERCCETGKSPA